MSARVRLGVLALTGALLAAPATFANGRFPAVDQLVAEPGNPEHLVLRTTFGLLVSKDGGAAWDFLCEDALGYRDTDPALAVLAGGRILLGLVDGVSVSDNSGCTFRHADGIDGHVIDVTAALAEPGTAYTATIAGTSTRFFASTDDGDTFAPLGEEIADFVATTLDAAPTNADVIYAAGVRGTAGAFLRSENRGETFVAFTVPNTTTARRPYIAAVDPTDARTVYVRTEGLPGLLFVTRDAGESFTRILALDIPVLGFALSPDGGTIVASNPYDGTFKARRDEYAFERVACKGPKCLLFDRQTLFGCGDNGVDGYIVGRSNDLGESFERVADFGCLEGPVACGASSGAGAICPSVWPAVSAQIGAGTCDPATVAPDRSCFQTAGAGGEAGAGEASGNGGGGTAGASGGRGGSAGAGQAGARPSEPRPAPEDGSCGCRLTSHAGSGNPLAALALLLSSFFARRATRRRSRPTGNA